MIPTLQVVKIQPAQFIAASESVTLGGSYDGEKQIEARSARFSRWEEDDFEEE